MTASNGDQKQITQIRMGKTLKARIKKFQTQFSKETGVQLTFGAAVRALVEHDLDRRGIR